MTRYAATQWPDGEASVDTSTVVDRAWWRGLIPLWDDDQCGVFVYDSAGRLAYANTALASMNPGHPGLGAQDFVFDVTPTARRAVHRALTEVRIGRRSHWSAIVPITANAGATLVRLMLTAVESTNHDRAVVGRAAGAAPNAVDVVGDDEPRLREALQRIVDEVAAVLPDVGPLELSAPRFSRLSDRQNEIVHLVFTGAGTAEIAERLFISKHTVRNHLRAIYRSLDVHSRSELVALCHARERHPSQRAARQRDAD